MNMPTAMLSNDMLGWAAALLTLMTFICRDMRRLRLLALAANAAFIAYGALAQLLPVLALHLALVPVNLWRLNQTLRPAPRWDEAAHSAALPEPARALPGRARSGWMPRRHRRDYTPRAVSAGSPATRMLRPGPTFADLQAIRQ